jgi:hypothetical protein
MPTQLSLIPPLVKIPIEWPVVSMRGMRGVVCAIAGMMRKGGEITNVRMDKIFRKLSGGRWSWPQRLRELTSVSRVVFGEVVIEGSLKPRIRIYKSERIKPDLVVYTFYRTPVFINHMLDRYEAMKSDEKR